MVASTKKNRVRKRTHINIIPTSWIKIVSDFVPLRPIKSKAVYDNAIQALQELAELPSMNEAQSDYFDVLSDLVVKYENENWPIDISDVSVVEILKSFMEDHNMNSSDLGRMLGNDRTLGHKVLTGKRKLTTDQIKILADKFKVSTDLFI